MKKTLKTLLSDFKAQMIVLHKIVLHTVYAKPTK